MWNLGYSLHYVRMHIIHAHIVNVAKLWAQTIKDERHSDPINKGIKVRSYIPFIQDVRHCGQFFFRIRVLAYYVV